MVSFVLRGSMGCEDLATSPRWWRASILGEHRPTSLNRGEGPRWWPRRWWWHPRRPTSLTWQSGGMGGDDGGVLYAQRHLTWQSGGVLRGCGGALEESGTSDFTEIVKVQHSRDSAGRTLFVEKPRHDVWIFTPLDPFSRLPKSPR